jgi:epoxyqueuosine reductase
LRRWAAGRGYGVGWGPLDVVAAAVADVHARGVARELDVYASEAVSSESAESLGARGLVTVVVVVKPRPAHTVLIDLAGERVEAILPPTYVRYSNTFEEVGRDLREEGLPGARVETLRAPLKQVASRLGLVSYGRNNVTYAPGSGSYIQLLGYLTDARLPLPDGWRPSEPALLPRCRTCRACLVSCPTGAIGEERVLLRAERCLTLANENPGPWPPWIQPKAHHCLLGCLLCQVPCPENPKLRMESAGVAFTREETEALLSDSEDHLGPAWDGVREKLARLGQPGAEAVLGRNVKTLAANRKVPA